MNTPHYAVECPWCHALPGFPCVYPDGSQMRTGHIERRILWLESRWLKEPEDAKDSGDKREQEQPK